MKTITPDERALLIRHAKNYGLEWDGKVDNEYNIIEFRHNSGNYNVIVKKSMSLFQFMSKMFFQNMHYYWGSDTATPENIERLFKAASTTWVETEHS